MDIYCSTCGEPWDNDSLHEVAEVTGDSYSKVAADFRSRGCEALEPAFGAQGCKPNPSMRTAAMSAMYELLGDDMDGAAAMMDDFEYAGMLED